MNTKQGKKQIQQEKWRDIMQVSERLLQLAESSDWQELDSLSEQREQWLKEFFATDISEELRRGIQEDIGKITEQDQLIVQLVQKNRSELADEITRLQARKKMINDYLSNSD